MDEDFLLESEAAKELYNKYAKDMPIIDYHCHLSPQEIAEDKKYKNITELWLGGDHYKWRALRANGVEEKFITGDASDKDKFFKWAETMPRCIGNPLYHWTHLELQRYFNIYEPLSAATAEDIWNKCNEMIKSDDFSARSLIKRSNVKALCTTDDPADTLEYHVSIAKDASFDVKVLPTFRPDRAIAIEKPDFAEYISKLSNTADMKIESFEDLKKALTKRMDFFAELGCVISDHGITYMIFERADAEKVNEIFTKVLSGATASQQETEAYKTELLLFLAKEYAKRKWTMQMHMGVIRCISSRMFKKLGPDTGFDVIGDYHEAENLIGFLNELDKTEELPKMIFYSLNPNDLEAMATVIGSFQTDEMPGKMQLGSGWWYNDHIDGMLRQMKALGNVGLLPNFVGMLTDSRSFLSYTRHEYFRRIVCNLLGEWMDKGMVPYDMDMVGNIAADISYNNAAKYFGIK